MRDATFNPDSSSHQGNDVILMKCSVLQLVKMAVIPFNINTGFTTNLRAAPLAQKRKLKCGDDTPSRCRGRMSDELSATIKLIKVAVISF